jgi:hypothetical protein
MSTPTGKPPNPADLSAYVAYRARERAAAERVTDEDEQSRSPYAPKPAHERGAVDPYPSERYDDPLRVPFAPRNARVEPSPDPRYSSADPPPLCPDDAHDSAAEVPLADEQPVELDENIPLQAASPAPAEPHDHQAAERRHEIMNDRDLERLEASLRWLQRQEAATRLPRGAQLARTPGLPPPDAHMRASLDARNRRYGADPFGEELRSPLSLEPERLPPPPLAPRGSLLAPLGIALASVIAAVTGYYVVVGWTPPSQPAPKPQMVSANTVITPPPSASAAPQQPSPARTKDEDRAPPAEGEISAQHLKTAPARRLPERETAAMAQPSVAVETPPAPSAPPARKDVVRNLDPEEIKLLMQQGEQFASTGDLVTARLAFQRAAEAGDPAAAIALGATYDPTVLAKLGVVGIAADVEKARAWYQKAETFGSKEAARRLSVLARQ